MGNNARLREDKKYKDQEPDFKKNVFLEVFYHDLLLLGSGIAQK